MQLAGRSGRAAAGPVDGSPLDESFVVPALVRFSGHPEVDDVGNLIYTFPDLQASSREQVRATDSVCVVNLTLMTILVVLSSLAESDVKQQMSC